MKRLLLLSLLFITLGLQAQNLPPQTINFQGVAIDKNGVPVPGMDEVGNPIQNASIRIRFTVLMGSATGTPSYQEEHLANTDEFGRFNLEIGRGTALIGPFTNIRWGEDRHFLKVETDLTGVGSAYTLSSVQEFLSVPYALYAKTAGNSNDDLDKDPQNEIQTLTLSGNLLSINQGNTVTLPADSDQQQLSISGAVITISNGNSISLPPDADNQVLAVSGNNLSIANGNTVALPVSPDNQALSISGNTLSISNGNSVALPPNTDNQTLAISGNAISISNGNSIILPTAPDNQTLALSGSTLTISNGNSVALPADSDNQTLSVSSSGSNRTVSIAGGNSVNFRVNDADSSATNELQTLSKAGNTISLSKNGGSVTDSDNQSLTISGNSLSISNGNSVALPPSTDNQTLAISGNAISISNGNSIILPTAPDNQTLALSGSTLTISNGNSVALPADSDNQTLSVVSSGNNRTVSIAGGNSVNFRVNDADSSATNELQTLSKAGNTISLSNGGGSIPDSDNQELSIAGNTISISNGNSINLPAASTGNQTLSLSGSTLSISNGNSVVLPGSTGSQTLNTSSSGNQRTVSISNGNSITLNINDADSSSTNELQTIAKANGVISLSNNGGSVIDSDNQTLSVVSSGSNRTVSIAGGNSVNFRVNDGDSSSTNEIQTISMSNDTIFLSNGGFVVLPSQQVSNLPSTISSLDSIYRDVSPWYSYVSSTYAVPDTHVDTLYLGNWGQLFEIGKIRISSGNGNVNSRFSVLDDNGNSLFSIHTNQDNSPYVTYSFATQGEYVLFKFENLGSTGTGQQLFHQIQITRIFSSTLMNVPNTPNTDHDQDSTNELQSISKLNGMISLSNNGGSVADSDNQNLSVSGQTLSISGGNSITLPISTPSSSTDTIHYGRNFFGFIGNTNGGNFSKTGPVDTIFNVQKGSTVKVFVSLSGVAFPTSSNGSCTIQWVDSMGQTVFGKYNISGSISLGSAVNLNMSQTSYNVEFEFVARRSGFYVFMGSASGFNQGGNPRGVTINTPIWQYRKL